jgi:hypothetical protein
MSAQPWIEDGVIFIQQQLAYGAHAIVTPYAGYFHLIPRVVTLVAVHASVILHHGILLTPFFMNLAAVALAALCAAQVCRDRFSWMAPLPWRCLFAVLLVGLPGSWEVFGIITNIQWWLAVYQFLIAWDIYVTHRIPAWPDLAVLGIAGFSGVFGVIPLLALIYVLVRGAMIRAKVTWPVVGALLLILPGPLIAGTTAVALRAHFPSEPVGSIVRFLLRFIFAGIFARIAIPGFVTLRTSMASGR